MTLDDFRKSVPSFTADLIASEMSDNTIKKYTQGLRNFIHYAEMSSELCECLCKDCFVKYKEYLARKYEPTTANLYLVAVNKYLQFLGSHDMCVKTFKLQNNTSLENCLLLSEYQAMLQVAKKDRNDTAYYVMRALASTGVRFGALEYFTVNVINTGIFSVTNKGKTRNVVIPVNVCEELQRFCSERGITKGYIFHARNPEKLINEPTVLRWLKAVAKKAEVDPQKAYPHNLRHLFAKTFMEVHNDLGELADLLGHTKIETTRIYARTSLVEKRKKLGELPL